MSFRISDQELLSKENLKDWGKGRRERKGCLESWVSKRDRTWMMSPLASQGPQEGLLLYGRPDSYNRKSGRLRTLSAGVLNALPGWESKEDAASNWQTVSEVLGEGAHSRKRDSEKPVKQRGHTGLYFWCELKGKPGTWGQAFSCASGKRGDSEHGCWNQWRRCRENCWLL